MISMFIETKVIETKTIKRVTNGYGPLYTNMSIVPVLDVKAIQLVVGAPWECRSGCTLNKKAVAELIEILKDTHSAMKE